jgi:O-antigen/teichoic acid export membrane protein
VSGRPGTTQSARKKAHYHGRRKVVVNAASLLSGDILDRIAVFAIYALVARFLGARQFGQLSVALTLFATFWVFAVAGVKTFITRGIARQPDRTSKYLVNGTLVVLAASLASVGLLKAFVQVMDYEPDSANVIVFLAWALVPASLVAVSEAVLQAWESMHFIAIASIPVSLLKIGFTAVLLRVGFGLSSVILVIILSYAFTLFLEWTILLHRIGIPKARPSLPIAWDVLKGASAFLGMEGLLAVTNSANVVLLSKFSGETTTAIYNAATQVLVPVALLNKNVVGATFPLMCRQFGSGADSLRKIAKRLIELLLIVALPSAVFLTLCGGMVLRLLYRTEALQGATQVLPILVWSLLLVSATNVFGPTLLASMREKLTLRIFAVNAVVSFALGLALIPPLGAQGAAISLVLLRTVNFAQFYALVREQLPLSELAGLTWKPAVSAAVMGTGLFILPAGNLAITMVIATLLYVVTLGLLLLLSTGTFAGFNARYNFWLSK